MSTVGQQSPRPVGAGEPTESASALSAALVWPVRVIGAAIAAMLIAAGTVSVVTVFFHRQHTSSATVQGPIHRVVVSTDDGSVNVRVGAAGAPVRVTTTTGSSFRDPTVTTSNVDGVLRLTGRCTGGFGLGDTCSVDFDVVVAPGTVLDLRSLAGDVRAEGADADVTATTSAGSVDLVDLRSQGVVAHTSAGSVSIGFAVPPTTVRASTSAGSVKVVVPADGTAYRRHRHRRRRLASPCPCRSTRRARAASRCRRPPARWSSRRRADPGARPDHVPHARNRNGSGAVPRAAETVRGARSGRRPRVKDGSWTPRLPPTTTTRPARRPRLAGHGAHHPGAWDCPPPPSFWPWA